MKITFLTTSFPRFKDDYSGVFIFELAKSLIDKGVYIRVICPNDDRSREREFMDGVEVIRFDYFIKGWQKLAYGGGGILENLKKKRLLYSLIPFFIASFLRSTLKHAKDSDIIHAHWYPSGVVAMISRYTLSIPSVLTIRGSDLKLIKSRVFRKLNRTVLRRVDGIITVSESLRDELFSMGLDRSNIVFIPNGIKMENMDDTGANFFNSKRSESSIILFAGSLRKIKGLDTLLHAFQMALREKGDLILVIVGEGPEFQRLNRMAEELGIKERVHFTGALTPREVREWMKKASLFVLPSTMEGRPNVVLEAMAEGLPVIGSDIPGIREIIGDGKTGFLFKPLCSEELSACIIKILNDRDLRINMGLNGKRKIRELGLTWEDCATKHLNFYKAILGVRSCNITFHG